MEYMSMRLGELGRHFAENVDALGLEPRQMRQPGDAGVTAGRRDRFQGCHWLYLGVHRDLSKQKTGQGAGITNCGGL